MIRPDGEILEALRSVPELVRTSRGDVDALREVCDVGMRDSYRRLVPEVSEVETRDYSLEVDDGTIRLRHYRPRTARTGHDAAVIYVHGGGMISGSIDIYDPVVRAYTARSDTQMFAVGYRLAPKARGSSPARDTLEAVRWVLGKAKTLGLDASRVAVMGDSAGGGVAAGAAILARDAGIDLAAQILIYPMLDDRAVEGRVAFSFPGSWDFDENFTGWNALLGPERGGPNVEPAAAPGRLKDFRGLAKAYVEVGDLDIFCKESVIYAHSLIAADVSCELHVWPGAPHGFEWIAPSGWLSDEAWRSRVRAIRAI